MTIVPYDEKYRDDMIFMILQAKDALGRIPRLNEDLLDIRANYLERGLMDAALEQLNDHSAVRLWAVKGNGRAIRFYEKCGFRPDGKELFSERHGSAEMRLVLER